MADEFVCYDRYDETLDNIKCNVRRSFAKIYAGLKARELKTLRQIEAIRKQCEHNVELYKHCVQNIDISYENECTILSEINNFGNIDFKKFNLDNNIFIIEDYICPNDDHMYSHKCIDDLTKNIDPDSSYLQAGIEEAAIKQITNKEKCVCYVHVPAEDVAKKFWDAPERLSIHSNSTTDTTSRSKLSTNQDDKVESLKLDNVQTDVNQNCEEDTDTFTPNINPTQDWLNYIKNQTETEPTHMMDVMEHSTIECT